MPARLGDPRSRIGHHGQAIRADRRCPFNHQPTGRVIEAQEVQLGSRCRIENVGEGQRQRHCESRCVGGLDRDIERMLQHARREHVAHQFWRNRAQTDLGVGQRLAIMPDHALRLDFQRQ